MARRKAERKKPTRAQRRLAKLSFLQFRRLSPEENIAAGKSPTARNYVPTSIKSVFTKKTAAISARQYESKKARALHDMTPAQTTEARKQGGLDYVSADQRERVAKAARTRVVSRVKKAVGRKRNAPDQFARQAPAWPENRPPPWRRRPLSGLEAATARGRTIAHRRLGLDDGRGPIFRRPGRRFHARLARFFQHGLCSMNDAFRHFVIDWEAEGEFRDEAPEFAASPFIPFCYASRFTKTCGKRSPSPSVLRRLQNELGTKKKSGVAREKSRKDARFRSTRDIALRRKEARKRATMARQ